MRKRFCVDWTPELNEAFDHAQAALIERDRVFALELDESHEWQSMVARRALFDFLKALHEHAPISLEQWQAWKAVHECHIARLKREAIKQKTFNLYQNGYDTLDAMVDYIRKNEDVREIVEVRGFKGRSFPQVMLLLFALLWESQQDVILKAATDV